MEKKDYVLSISSDHNEPAAPSQVDSIVCEQQTSSIQKASTGTAARQKSKCHRVVKIMFIIVILVLTGIPFTVVSTSIVFPVMIIILVILYWITNIHQLANCDDYAVIDDTYDTELGTYWHELVLWMIHLTGLLIADLVIYLVIFLFGPFHLRELSLVRLPIWKWFLIGIIFLTYFVLWCMSRLSFYKIRECFLSKQEFMMIYVFHIYEALLGVAIWGLYFLVEYLVFKIVAPSIRPRILGLDAHKWVHALVYVFIGINVGRIFSAFLVAILQYKHYYQGKFDRFKDAAPPKGEDASKEPTSFFDFIGIGRRLVMKLVFKDLDKKRCDIYIVVGLRRNISFVLVSIWLLTTWTTQFVHHLRPSPDTVWIIRAGTATFYCLLIISVLWLLKNSIMLWWEYRSMYNNFYRRVLEAGTQLYRLGMIYGEDLDVLRVEWSRTGNFNDNKSKKAMQKRIERVVAKAKAILCTEPKSNAGGQEEDQHQPGIYIIMRMVRYFLLAEDVFKKNMNKAILTDKWLQMHSHLFDDGNSRKTSYQKLRKEAYEAVKDNFESKMIRSYETCYIMVNTLASAQQLAIYLNRAMVIIIIPLVIGIWLIMFTRSTKPVTIFAAPILAVSFIFGDTLSTVFKGIIFSYIVTPYDIGDRCFIKDTWYEVKRIDFWQTTFLKVDTNEEVLYPNSALFNESIIKNDGSDTLERLQFTFESDANLLNIVKLADEIDDYFLKVESIMKEHVEVKYDSRDTRKRIDLIIYFKHKLKDDPRRPEKMKSNKDELKDHIMKLCNKYSLTIHLPDEKENADKS